MERETEKGFTFMEIMIAAGILSLLAALSVRPMKDYLRRVDFKNNSQNIKRLVQTAQSKAMGNPNVHIGVFLDRVSTPQPGHALPGPSAIPPRTITIRGRGSGLPGAGHPEKGHPDQDHCPLYG